MSWNVNPQNWQPSTPQYSQQPHLQNGTELNAMAPPMNYSNADATVNDTQQPPPPDAATSEAPQFISPVPSADNFTDIRKDEVVEVGIWDEKEAKVVKREKVKLERPPKTSFQKFIGHCQSVLDALGCSFIPINILARQGEVENDDNNYEIIMTERGVVYQKKVSGDDKSVESDDESVNDSEVIKEHMQTRLTPWALLSKIEKVYGLSIYLYFDFIRVIILMNFILSALQLANYIIHWVVDSPKMVNREFSLFGWMYFIISSSHYSNSEASGEYISTLWLWRATNLVAIALTFIAGPLYFIWVTCIFRRRKVKDTENFSRHTRLDIIKENLKVGVVNKIMRRLLVYTFILILLIIQFGVVFILTKVQVWLSESSRNSGNATQDTVTFVTNTGASILISVVVVLLNSAFRGIGTGLTRFERYKTYTGFKQSNLIKLLLFKVLNVFIVGVAKTVDTGEQCPLSLIGQQYLILMLVDIFLMNALEAVKPVLNRVLWCCISTILCKERKSKRNSDAELKPEFNISDEYVEIVYRQYLIILSMPAFPLAPLMGFIGGIAELTVDRVKLMRFSRKPPISRSSMKSALSFFLLLIAVFAAFNPGAGSIYLLHFFPYWCDRSDCSQQCVIFNTHGTA